MKRPLLVAIVLVLLSTLSLGTIFAQYDADDILQRLVNNERRTEGTTDLSISVNNVLGNVLDAENSPSGRVDRNGFSIVVLGRTQASLPVVGSLPAGLYQQVTLRLEGTTFQWVVRVDPDGMFLTNFPMFSFPPGEYYLTVNNVRVFRVIIPEDYAPVR
jgi:hypothetical protein